MIRKVYALDPVGASALHERMIRPGFRPSAPGVNAGVYGLLYRIFGFRRAEGLRSAWLRVRKR